MKALSDQPSKVMQFKVTPTMKAQLAARAATLETTIAEYIRGLITDDLRKSGNWV